MGRKGDQGVKMDPLGWMFTFSDLVTLLLTFFVMLLTMKEPEVPKMQEAFGFFAAGGSPAIMDIDGAKPKDASTPGAIHKPSVDDLLKESVKLSMEMGLPPAAKAALAQKLQGKVSFRRDQRGEVITLANDLLFGPASAALSDKARRALKEVAVVLRQVDVPMVVEGHTDDAPPNPATGFRDNWQLSLARALAVLDYLVQEQGLPPDLMRVGALGETRPLKPNRSREQRAMNRRTEIVLLTGES
ncbi:OmpA/MotB family protein [Dethiosulfatarculus sandiegensis]|uniref:OmpA-like domain-containing protein n=1 Tax=Dethiosulfatarculus sandiegensis TaxID=1429043 RepID=A0A0D2JVD8_9BACT|nr:flagellar motor protein MotB [Dethiosulfatarculus sandiegensis]KIX13510.1 hypothetical protein X474_13575 [Dethiosulfatarculus sandiegensis]